MPIQKQLEVQASTVMERFLKMHIIARSIMVASILACIVEHGIAVQMKVKRDPCLVSQVQAICRQHLTNIGFGFEMSCPL